MPPVRSCFPWLLSIAILALLFDAAEGSRRYGPVGEVSFEVLSDPFAIEVSPNGTEVYAVGRNAGALARFDRDPASGDIALREFIEGSFLRALAFSPDGTNLYVGIPGGLAVYARDAVTSDLTFVESHSSGVGTPNDIEVVPDGMHLYAAGFGIGTFERDGATGGLTFLTASSPGSLDRIVSSPDGAHLYGTVADSLRVWSRDAGTGALTLVEQKEDGVGGVEGLRGALGVAVAPDGAQVYVAGEDDDAVVVFQRDPVTGGLALVETIVDDRDGVDGLDHVRDVGVSGDGAHVYASSSVVPFAFAGENAVVAFSRDAVTGQLTFLAALSGDAKLAGAVRLAISPDDATVYTVAEHGDGLAVLARDVGTGLLSMAGGWFPITGATSVVSAARATHLYAAHPSLSLVSVLRRSPGTGEIVLLDQIFDGEGGLDGLGAVGALALSPDEAHLYAVGRLDSSLVVFARDGASGALSFVQSAATGLGPRSVAVSPDGRHVYVANHLSSSLTVFGRDVATGAVAATQTVFDGIDGVEGLAGATALAVSPDGLHVYAVSDEGDAVVAFSRDGTTGELTFVEAQIDSGLLRAASSILVDPSGAYVYVASSEGRSVVAFSRDAATGRLSIRDKEVNGDRGVRVPVGDPLLNGSALATSARGDHLFLVGNGTPGVSVFGWEPDVGVLSFVHFQPEAAGVHGLWVSPDDEVHVLGAVRGSFSIVYGTVSGCAPAPLPGCRSAGKGSLRLRVHPLAKKETVRWVWARGAATTQAEFDFSGRDAILCGYDESGATPVLAFEYLMPYDADCSIKSTNPPCWEQLGTKLRYKDSFSTPDGIRQARLKPGDAGAAKIVVIAQGEDVKPAALPLGVPLRVQLQALGAPCWEATYGAPSRNDAQLFKAKAD